MIPLFAELIALGAERDALRVERDALKTERDALSVELDTRSNAAEHALDEINTFLRSPKWEYPAQVMRDVKTQITESEQGWQAVAGALVETYAGGPKNLPACVARVVAERDKLQAAVNESGLLRERARRAAQTLIAEIGAQGPETVSQTATRAANLIRFLREDSDRIEQLNRDLAAQLDDRVAHEQSSDVSGFMQAVMHDVRQANEAQQREADAGHRCPGCGRHSAGTTEGACNNCGHGHK